MSVPNIEGSEVFPGRIPEVWVSAEGGWSHENLATYSIGVNNHFQISGVSPLIRSTFPWAEDQSHTKTVEEVAIVSLSQAVVQVNSLPSGSSAPHSAIVILKWSEPAQPEVGRQAKGSASAAVASLSQASHVVSQASHRREESRSPEARELPRGIQLLSIQMSM
uniref:Uncharacterized protein n=1 Tax=Ditylenchus dipsaci TaxID=166011 RepID=A0A915EFS2_9BILA